MLSKEECLLKYNALKNLSGYPILCGTENDENLEPTPFNELFKEELECFEQIINEYFCLIEKYEQAVKCYKHATSQYSKLETKYVLLKSNPSLKFKDLYYGMWVWDNKCKEYIYVYSLDNKNKRILMSNICYLKFEENRFFLSEVKENVD